MQRHRTMAAFNKRKAVILAGIALLGGWLPPGHAEQSLFPLDPQADPTKPSNKPMDKFRLQTDDAARAKSLTLPGRPQERQEKGKGHAPMILLKQVVFEGNEIIPNEELEAVAAPYLNRPLHGVEEVEDLRHKLTLLYVDQGYVNSGAVIAKQRVKDGVLHIKLIEGKMTDVRVTDKTAEASEKDWFSRLWPLRDDYLRDRLLGDPEQPLNAHDLQQRYLMLLNDPLVERLNGTLMPGLHPGEAVLDLKVVRARPYGGYLGADNYTPPTIGGYAGRMGAWVSNLSGFGERIDFNFSATGGANTYNAGIDIPLSARGTRFAFRYTNSVNTLIEAPFDTLNIYSNIISYDGQLSHPVLWNLRQKLTLGLNFNVRQDLTTLDGSPVSRPGADNGQTQETVVRTWQDYLHQSKDFDLALRSTFSVGVNALGATITSQVGDGRFFDWLGQGVVRYRLPPLDYIPDGTFFSLSGAVQLADDKLLPLEKMALGGVYTVRGYRQNYLVRDEGFYTAFEVNVPIYGGTPGSKHSLFVVPFVNYGGGWDYGDKATYLNSAGLGLDWHYSTLSASVYWANRLSSYKLTNGTPYDLQDNGVTFQVNWRSF